MKTLSEKDLYHIENYTDLRVDNIHERWDFNDSEFDQETWEVILRKIFNEQNPKWLKILKRNIKNNRYNIEYFSIYWAKYRDEIISEFQQIGKAIGDISYQIQELEDSIEDFKVERTAAEDNYYDLEKQVEDLTGNRAPPRINRIWENPFENLTDKEIREIEDEVEPLLDEMEDLRNSYIEYDDLIEIHKSLIEKANENLEQAQDLEYEISRIMNEY